MGYLSGRVERRMVDGITHVVLCVCVYEEAVEKSPSSVSECQRLDGSVCCRAIWQEMFGQGCVGGGQVGGVV